jgi:hypothetical protein
MTVYTFDYSTEYDPPGPIVEFQVSKAGQQTPDVTLSALVDSGADATMLPITALQSIGGRYVETRQMRGIVGLAYPVDLYLVSIWFDDHQGCPRSPERMTAPVYLSFGPAASREHRPLPLLSVARSEKLSGQPGLPS